MTQLKLVKGLLKSRSIREKAGGIKGKIRYLDIKHPITREGETKNVLDQIGDAFNSLKGFITGNGWWAKLFQNGISGAFNWLMTGLKSLVTFDFNQSDKQLEQLLNAQADRVAATLGTLAGSIIGWTASIAVGYGVSLAIPVIGGAGLARAVTAIAKAEAVSEISSGIGAAILDLISAAGTGVLVGGYYLARKAIKRGKETKEGGPVISVSAGVEYVVNLIPLGFVRTFINSALDSATDSFWEGGTIIAYELDNAYEQAKRAQENARGRKRTIRLKPDKNRKEETITITANQVDLQEEVVSTLNNYRLIANRDVGQIVGMPAEDFVSAKPLRRSLTIIMKAKKEPPWKVNGKQAKNVTVTIPDAIVGLTWAKIKLAAQPYSWGKFRATANLDNGRQMAIYASNRSEAEKVIKRFLTLTTAKILSLSVTEEVDKKNINLKKQPVQVYPAHATVLIRRNTTGEGRDFVDGSKMVQESVRIDLWQKTEPKGIPPLK